jgi:hypothetical protein
MRATAALVALMLSTTPLHSAKGWPRVIGQWQVEREDGGNVCHVCSLVPGRSSVLTMTTRVPLSVSILNPQFQILY